MNIRPFLLLLVGICLYWPAFLMAEVLPSSEPEPTVETPALEDEELDYLDDDWLDEEDDGVLIADPIEPVNRGIFWFNDKLYFYLFKPVARGYRAVVPEPARVSVANFFSNLATPIRFVNAALQLKLGDAGTELGRFAINTTVGIGGLFDPAKKYAGLDKKEEDFGQTLGRYGVGSGFYIVLPVFGPSNVRDGLGRFVDHYLDPVTYLADDWDYVAIKAFDRVNALSLDKDTYEGIVQEALDPYLFVRDAYAQNRAGKIDR